MAGYPTDEEWLLTHPNVRCWDTGIPSIGSVFLAGDGLHYMVEGRRLTEEHELLVEESTAR
jgi:hypothetical protein